MKLIRRELEQKMLRKEKGQRSGDRKVGRELLKAEGRERTLAEGEATAGKRNK